MSERLGNLGYIAFGKETTAGTAVTPGFFTNLYKETLTTNLNLIDDNPVAGNKFMRQALLQGTRSHGGVIELYGDPNSLVYAMDMIATRGSITGSGPYTWPFAFTGNSNSFTCDISNGFSVTRFMGVMGSKLEPKWDKEELHVNLTVSATGSFHSRMLASTPTGSGPYTVVLDTTYDPNPTNGLVTGDLIQFTTAAGAGLVTATVASVTNGTTFTTSTNVTTFLQGAFVYLRPQTPTYSLLTPCLWGLLQYRTASTASGALTATQLRVDKGSDWSIIHKFNDDKGENRSGGFDPQDLARTQVDGTLKIKRYFDTVNDLQTWENMTQNAWVLRFFNGSTSQYEFRLTFDGMEIKDGVKPSLESAKILYSEETLAPVYNSTNGEGMSVTVIAGIPSF